MVSVNRKFLTLAAVLAFTCVVAQAAPPELIPVGNTSNKSDATGYGAVSYEYKIGKYEVTNAEYCEFLNAVAKNDPYELYDGRMGAWNPDAEQWGGIERNGPPGSFTYKVIAGNGKRPVNFVTWQSAARYCNWLNSGDTEKGIYNLGVEPLKLPKHAELAKGEKPTWVLPTEDEWYKAAYYDASKAGYWRYPGKSDEPSQANIGSNQPTEGGTSGPASAYGTFDQGGNVWEFNESRYEGKAGLRGSSFWIADNAGYMDSYTRYDDFCGKWPHYGFRVAAVGGAK